MKTDYTQEQRYIRAKKRVDNIKSFYIHFTVYILVNIFISAIIIFGLTSDEGLTFSQAISHPGVYMTWLGWGIGVVIHWLSVFGFPKVISQDWEERKIRELMEQDEDRKEKYLNK